MKRHIYIISLLLFSVASFSQSRFDDVIKTIESNNTTLKAYDQQRQANHIANHTGINMENPEVEFGRMWGTNSRAEGYKYDFGVTQTFDFPTAYYHKKKLAKQQDVNVDLEYMEQRNEVLNEARVLCLNLIFQERMYRELTDRRVVADQIFKACQKRFETGDIDVLERNKARINLLNAEKALQLCEVEMSTLKAELERLNGGIAFSWNEMAYPDYTLPVGFDDWFMAIVENNPSIAITRNQISTSKRQEQVTKSLNLPKITAGYRNAYEAGGRFSGFVVGMSVPLWGGKNTVKQRKAETNALTIQYEDNRTQFRNQMKSQYDKALKLDKLLKEYEEVLEESNSHKLLLKSFELGQLSLIGYLQEVSIYNETMDTYLNTEKEYYLSLDELKRWEAR